MNKLKGVFWIILSAALLGIVLARIPAQFIDYSGDSSQYIILAESVASGQGLRMVNFPGEPLSAVPPLLSWLLAPVISFSGRNFWLMSLFAGIFSCLSAAAFYFLFRRSGGGRIALFAVSCLVLNRIFIFYSGRILTETLFLCLCGFSFLMLARYKDKGSFLNREGVLAALALIAAYFARYIGAFLFIAGLLYLYSDRPDSAKSKDRLKKLIFLTILFLPPVILWGLRNLNIHNPYIMSPLEHFIWGGMPPGLVTPKPAFLVLRAIQGGSYYFYQIGVSIFPFLRKSSPVIWWNVFSLTALVIMAAGIFTRIRKGQYGLAVFFLLYLIFICLWPSFEDGRYFLPILPLVFFYFLSGLERLCGFIRLKHCFFAIAAILLIIHLVFTVRLARQPDRAMAPPGLNNFLMLNTWLKENLAGDESVVLSRQPAITYLYSGHKSICYPYDPDPEAIRGEIVKHKIKYILIGEFTPDTAFYMGPFLDKYRDSLQERYRQGESVIFEVLQ
jgi:4-amino-4-deoxy-L-arabinose transferase-like glycosyltransferase